MSRTRSDVYAPAPDATAAVPESAWASIDPPADPATPEPKARKKG